MSIDLEDGNHGVGVPWHVAGRLMVLMSGIAAGDTYLHGIAADGRVEHVGVVLDAVWIVLFLGTCTCVVSLPLPFPVQ